MQHRGRNARRQRRVLAAIVSLPSLIIWAPPLSGQPAAEGQDVQSLIHDEQTGVITHQQMLKGAVKLLKEQLASREYTRLADSASELVIVAPDDARVLYLFAEALAALDDDEEAQLLRDDALSLHPDKETPHYVSGELLMELGRYRLAAREWETILKIPPDGEVYDINAHLRLATIYEASGLFEKAAHSLSTASEAYAVAQEAGHGMGIVGGTADSLRAKIDKLREMARRHPAPEAATITDKIGEETLHVNVAVQIKDGKQKELSQQLKTVAGTLDLRIQPHGLRLFDVAPTSLTYDSEKQRVAPTLNGRPCGKWVPLQAPGPKFRVALRSLDCCYIFEIDSATGEATKLARFEQDYTVKFEPGIKLGALKDVSLTINGKERDWAKCLEGVEFDFLPEAMEISLEGITPRGRRITTRTTIQTKTLRLWPTVR